MSMRKGVMCIRMLILKMHIALSLTGRQAGYTDNNQVFSCEFFCDLTITV